MLKLLPFMLFFPIQILAGVGDVDNRYYVTDEMWAQEPYKNFVLLKQTLYNILISMDENGEYTKKEKIAFSEGTCSAQFISPNLILSAGHCTTNGRKDLIEYSAKNYKGENIKLELVYTPWNPDSKETDIVGDWAVWLVTDPKYYSDSYLDVKIPTIETNVINAGWGWARIIPDSELQTIRQIFDKISQGDKRITVENVRQELEKILPDFDIEALTDTPVKLKASDCTIIFDSCTDKYDKNINSLEETVFDESLDMKVREKAYFKYLVLRAKINKKCDRGALIRSKNFPEILATTCDTWGGNSGGGYISNDGKNVYGIVHAGASTVYDSTDSNYMTSSKQFKEKLLELITMYDSKNSKEDNIAKIPEQIFQNQSDSSETTDEEESNMSHQMNVKILSLTSDIESLGGKLEKDINNVKNMTNEELLSFLNKLVEYDVKKERLEKLKQTFEDVKANEQSLANRTLTAASIAATGIGGMELAMGLSEQKADKEAQQDMSAYIASFRCEYGNGKQVKAGPEEIVLPGGNDEKLMSLRTKYMTLATDLKERKTALGMKPGIESEEILDKTAMNLYDDENTGIESGAYGSLYRAKMLGSEEDQAKLDEEAKKSKNRVIAGATVAGAGIVGGIAGNMAINGTDGKKNLNKIQEARTTENGMSPIPAKRDICTMVCELNDETKKKIHSENFGCTCTE